MTTFLGQTNLPYIEGKPLAKTLALGDTPNLEAVLQAGPDLILARKPEQKVYDQLSQVAPTVILDIPSDWRQAFREVGTVVGHEKQAEEWLSNYDKKAADIRGEISGYVKPGSTFLYLRIMPKEIRVHGTQELFGATLFQDLKLTPVPGLEQVKRIEPISLEKLPDYDADYIFLQVGSPPREATNRPKRTSPPSPSPPSGRT
ncbi:ABC transporter substrate-binding protein [Paenibacillus sp. P25]|nr:ABC transporter substrate-binding protein [Paenibacillus sp. P25]